ncbi:MAG TPA: FtsX-like permease family protein [Saprospiraceae bacterium]|nr:FtsX-like permease family protein [Saprospiraceae bacterium]
MLLIKVAWRNIWRNKKRSAIIIAAIGIGLFAGIFLIAFYNGMIEERIRMAIEQEISHLQLHHPEFNKDHDPAFIIPQGPSVLQSIRSNPDVKAATGRIALYGMIASASGSSGVRINGIDPESEQAVTGIKNKLIAGNYFQNDRKNEILISRRLIDKLKLNLRNKTVLTFQDHEGNLASGAFKISGIFKTSNGPYDEGNIFIRIHDIDSLCGLVGAYHEIAVQLHSNLALDKSQQLLQKNFPDLLTENWMQISPELELTVSVTDQMVLIFMGIILLALAFGIINTMMMSVLERTREIGMLLALGMTRFRIFGMIVLETIFLVLAGSPLGIAVALVAIRIASHTGIQFEKFKTVYESFGYGDTVYPVLHLPQFLLILALVVITALLSAVFPARSAFKINPVTSIRK